MLLLFGVLLFCGAVIALAWAYEVNRREPKPRWARIEMIWETLLATLIGVAMVGILLALKSALRIEGPASLVPLELLGVLTAVAATPLVVWYLLRPLRASRLAAAARAAAGRPEAVGQRASVPENEEPTDRPSGTGARSAPTRRKAA